jgi:hypothetical protein
MRIDRIRGEKDGAAKWDKRIASWGKLDSGMIMISCQRRATSQGFEDMWVTGLEEAITLTEHRVENLMLYLSFHVHQFR